MQIADHLLKALFGYESNEANNVIARRKTKRDKIEL